MRRRLLAAVGEEQTVNIHINVQFWLVEVQVLLLDWMKVPSVILVAENRHKKEGRSTDYFKVSET